MFWDISHIELLPMMPQIECHCFQPCWLVVLVCMVNNPTKEDPISTNWDYSNIGLLPLASNRAPSISAMLTFYQSVFIKTIQCAMLVGYDDMCQHYKPQTCVLWAKWCIFEFNPCKFTLNIYIYVGDHNNTKSKGALLDHHEWQSKTALLFSILTCTIQSYRYILVI